MTLSFYFRYMSPSVPFVSCGLTPLLEGFLAVIRITVILFSIRMWCLVWILMICKPKTCTCIYNWRNPIYLHVCLYFLEVWCARLMDKRAVQDSSENVKSVIPFFFYFYYNLCLLKIIRNVKDWGCMWDCSEYCKCSEWLWMALCIYISLLVSSVVLWCIFT